MLCYVTLLTMSLLFLLLQLVFLYSYQRWLLHLFKRTWLLNSILHKTCDCSKMASPVRRFRMVEYPIFCYFYMNSCTVCKMKNEEPLIAKSNLVLGLCRASDLIPKRDTWTRRGMHKASVCNSKGQLVFLRLAERNYV